MCLTSSSSSVLLLPLPSGGGWETWERSALLDIPGDLQSSDEEASEGMAVVLAGGLLQGATALETQQQRRERLC